MIVRRWVLAVVVLSTLDIGAAYPQEFPFDQVLNMDVAPMRPSKRKPSLTIAPNGSAVIDLWCKSIEGKVDVAGDAITITPAELPEALPAMMSNGQCTPDRMQADQALRDALAQVSAWRRQGGAVVFSGSAPMRFFPSTN